MRAASPPAGEALEQARWREGCGFTLIELLVTIAIIALLVGILAPSLGVAREHARVVRVQAELRLIGDGLEGYAMQNDGQYPPTRTYCEMEKRHHWCDLPVELVDEKWLPAGSAGTFLSSAIEDEFNPGHTYKYKAPGWGLHNNGWVPKAIWVPEDFPFDDPDADASQPGRSYDNVTKPLDADGRVILSPVSWAIWSLGPNYDPAEGSPLRAPVPKRTWYRGYGTRGVIARIRAANGLQYATFSP